MPRIIYEPAGDVRKLALDIIRKLGLNHIDPDRIFFVRSRNSRSSSVARIWGLPRIWRNVLNLEPMYVIEVLSEKYDKLSENEKIKILIHELLHIPSKFSGGLRPHGKYVNRKKVNELYLKYLHSQP